MSKNKIQFHSKNFDAAQKHFMKKEQQYTNEIKYLRTELEVYKETVAKLTAENENLREQVHAKSVKIDELLKLTKLSEEDLCALLKKSKNLDTLVGCINGMSRVRY